VTAPLNTITTIRLPDGSQVAFVDWSDKPVFSTVELCHGFTQEEIDVFGYTLGDPVPAAPPAALAAIQRSSTDRDTNLAAPASMASTEERMIYAIKPEVFYLQTDAPAGGQVDMETATAVNQTGQPLPGPVFLAQLNRSLLLTLEISRKVFARAGFGFFNAGFGVHGFGAVADATRSYAVNGLPSQEAVRTYVVPQYMGGTEKFRLYLSNPTGQPCDFGNGEAAGDDVNTNAVARIHIYLEGLYKRPVS
jgi:hypothetical protein